MESFLEWGIDVVLWFQQASPTFDLFFKALTFLGNEEFFLIFLPLVYWCADRRAGVRLLILFLSSAYINSAAKVLVDQPRPFEYDHRVEAIIPAGGGGLPSGHTQSTVVLWGYLAYRFRHKFFWIIVGCLFIGVPLSRIYLGVHFPTDIIGGYVLGGCVLLGFIRLAPRIESWISAKGFSWQIGMAVILPGMLILLSPSADPYCLTAGSTLGGFCCGVVLERRWVAFRTGGMWWRQVFRYLVGIFVLVCLWMGLRLAFQGLQPEPVLRVIRYTTVGLWCSLGAPWLFVRLKIAEKE